MPCPFPLVPQVQNRKQTLLGNSLGGHYSPCSVHIKPLVLQTHYLLLTYDLPTTHIYLPILEVFFFLEKIFIFS